MWLHIDDQIELLADPNHPRRPDRVDDTFELVAHTNYIVILEQNLSASGSFHAGLRGSNHSPSIL